MAGICSVGGDVKPVGTIPTPAVAYLTVQERADAGIVISASHNPYYDNGIKLLNEKGEKMDEETILKIEDYLDGKTPEPPLAKRGEIGCTVDYIAGRNRYVGYLISLAIHSFRGKRVGLDCANGSSWQIAKGVFDALGAKTYVINAQPDGLNINENCGSTHIEVLRKFVLENQLDVGFAYDGDADRCIAVDEYGNVCDGDTIMYVCGAHLAKQGKLSGNTVVATVMSNIGLFKALDKLGIGYEKTDVGDKYVSACMQEHGYALGGEQSGHVIFSEYSATGDGINTSLRIMQALVETGKSLAELAKPLKIYPQLLKNVKVEDKHAVMEHEAVKAAAADVEAALEGEGRALIRASGTEPLVRVMVEAPTIELCEQYVNKVVEVIESL